MLTHIISFNHTILIIHMYLHLRLISNRSLVQIIPIIFLQHIQRIPVNPRIIPYQILQVNVQHQLDVGIEQPLPKNN